jgi:GNAT superfamily N-acetyltransferase
VGWRCELTGEAGALGGCAGPGAPRRAPPSLPGVNPPSIDRHLTAYLGKWPPAGGVGGAGVLEVVGSERRDQPGWDGTIEPLFGVVTPSGGVLSVSPSRVEAVRSALDGRGVADLPAVFGAIASALDHPGGRMMYGIFRWSVDPVPMPDAGVWVAVDDAVVPDWLEPFGGEVLVALEGGGYVAGVGLKRHDPTGEEIAVGTEPAARGKGLARRLVSQAARRVLERGAVVTYLHAPDNVASARVAEAAGFPDLGWRAVGLVGR